MLAEGEELEKGFRSLRSGQIVEYDLVEEINEQTGKREMRAENVTGWNGSELEQHPHAPKEFKFLNERFGADGTGFKRSKVNNVKVNANAAPAAPAPAPAAAEGSAAPAEGQESQAAAASA